MTLVQWSWVLVLLAAGGWGWTITLVRAALTVKEPALEERATASVILSLCASIFALLGLAFIFDIDLGSLVTVGLITIALLLNSPQYIWGIAYMLRRFQ